MTEKEEWKCLNKLLESTNQVLIFPLSTHIETSERITELFKQIQDDYRIFKEVQWDDEIRLHVHQETHAQFQMALLVLSYCAKKNKQMLQPSTSLYSDFSEKELKVYDLLKKFDLLYAYSPIELRQKLIDGDKIVESFFKEYIEIKQSLNQLINHEDIRPGIRQYLKKQGDYYHEIFKMAFGSDGGRFIVTSSTAQQSELNFIYRIETKLRDNGNQINFLGSSFTVDKIVKELDFIKRSQKIRSTEKNRFGITKNMPENQYIKAVFTEKSIALRKRSYTFYAVFASHIEHYSGYEFDCKPLELKEINDYIESIINDPREKTNHILFCIASPTGFENIEHTASDNVLDGYQFPNISICLYDLHINKKFFNKFDRLSNELSKFCDLKTEEENYFKLKELLHSEMDRKLLVHLSVSLNHCRDFSKNHGYQDLDLVKKIFNNYAKEKKLTVEDIPQLGLVIIKKM